MSAKVDIWMPLYVADYLSATSRLTTEQHGAYLLILMDYWKNGPPPDNDGVLAQITRLSPSAWSNARTMLEAFFQVESGKWLHHRVDDELAKANHNKEVNRRRGLAGAAAKYSKKAAPTMLEASLGDSTSPSPTPSPTKRNTGRDARATRLPDQDLPDSWRDFCQTERPDLVPDQTYAKFRDYWTAKPGKAGTKLDWLATWRNWVREEKRKAGEPAWRTEQRKRTLEAVPSIAQGGSSQVVQFFDVEAKNVTAIALG